MKDPNETPQSVYTDSMFPTPYAGDFDSNGNYEYEDEEAATARSQALHEAAFARMEADEKAKTERAQVNNESPSTVGSL